MRHEPPIFRPPSEAESLIVRGEVSLASRGRFELPSVEGMLKELRTLVAASAPTAAIFRTNHASNHLPLEGRLPRDRDRIVATLDRALVGGIPLRPEWARGL